MARRFKKDFEVQFSVRSTKHDVTCEYFGSYDEDEWQLASTHVMAIMHINLIEHMREEDDEQVNYKEAHKPLRKVKQ